MNLVVAIISWSIYIYIYIYRLYIYIDYIYISNYYTVHFKLQNFTCQLYLNKAEKKDNLLCWSKGVRFQERNASPSSTAKVGRRKRNRSHSSLNLSSQTQWPAGAKGSNGSQFVLILPHSTFDESSVTDPADQQWLRLPCRGGGSLHAAADHRPLQQLSLGVPTTAASSVWLQRFPASSGPLILY